MCRVSLFFAVVATVFVFVLFVVARGRCVLTGTEVACGCGGFAMTACVTETAAFCAAHRL